jgi:hypothetical protein
MPAVSSQGTASEVGALPNVAPAGSVAANEQLLSGCSVAASSIMTGHHDVG